MVEWDSIIELAAVLSMVLAALADVITTQRFLRRGYIEMNPAMSWAMLRFGRGWIVIKLALTGSAIWLAVWFGIIAWLWPLAALTAYVSLRNWRLVK